MLVALSHLVARGSTEGKRHRGPPPVKPRSAGSEPARRTTRALHCMPSTRKVMTISGPEDHHARCAD
ncbi:hypothetical protein GQ607_001935 [Colletotrichum asianum]|uniref:Uncharacterized protein n=1 Tax=Colletotrichum asianum TaxID=702518 RepID=A0A8H3WRK7_9PEZI|nr:hypothetical protein GQ607_001935 [Colletotrichum asianum]